MTNESSIIRPASNVADDRVRTAYGSRNATNAQDVSVITYTSKADVRKILDKDIKKYHRGYYLEVQSLDEGVLQRNNALDIDKSVLLVSTINGNREKNVDNATHDIMSVDCFNAQLSYKLQEEEGLNNALQLLLRAHRFYYCVNKDDNSVRLLVPRYSKTTNQFEGYSELCDPNARIIYKASQGYIYDILNDKYNITTYYTFLTSPSGQRKNSCLVIRATIDSMSEMTKFMDALVNKLTCGAWDVMKAAYHGKNLSFNKMCKLLSRLTLPITGSAEYGEITTMAIYMGDSTYTDDKGNKIAFADGQNFMNASVLQKAYYAKHKIWLDPSKLISMVNQDRMAGCIKGVSVIVSGNSMATNILATCKDITYVSKEEADFDFSVKLQRGGSDVDGKLFVIGTNDLTKVDLFVDLTTLKAVPDLSQFPFKVNLMEIAGKFSSHTSLSLQYASGLMKVPGAENVFADLLKDQIEEYFDEEKKSLSSIHQLKSVDYVDDVLWAVASEFVKMYNPLLFNRAKQIAKSVTNLINEFSLKIKGFYGKIIADNGARFGCPVLSDNEVYVGGRHYVGELDMIRYPHNFSGEHFLCNAISLKTIVDRIDDRQKSGIYTAAQASSLKEYFMLLPEGAIVVPSWNRRYARLLGGCDYDGDGVICVIDTRIIELAKQLPEMAIDFGSPKDAGKEVPALDIWCKDFVYRSALENPNDPVGVITNRGNSFISLAENLKTMSDEAFEELKEYFVNSLGREDSDDKDSDCNELFLNNQLYTRRYTKSEELIDSAEVDKYWAAVKAAGLNTRENMINIFTDMQPVTSSVGGRSIDSAKTGETVFAPFQVLGRYVKAGLDCDIAINVEENKDLHTLEINFNGFGTGLQSIGYVSDDLIARLKNRFGEYATDKLKKFYSDAIASRED